MEKISRRQMLKTLITGAAGVTLAACAPQAVTNTQVVKETATPERQNTATPAPPNPVTISWWQPPIWHYAPDNTTLVGANSEAKGIDAVKRFQARYPWITVKMELISWDLWNQKVSAGFASGTVANVIYNSQTFDHVQSGLLEPLDDFLTPAHTDNWLAGLKAALTYSGHVYGIPWAVAPYLTTFSQTSLEKFGAAGLMTDVGADRGNVTFDMLMEYGKAYADNKTCYFWGVPMGDDGSILYWMFGSWLEGWGVKSWDDAEERWQVADHPNSVKAFQWLLDAAAAGVMPPIKSLPQWSDLDNFFWAGNLAGRLHWATIQADLGTAQAAGQAARDFKLFFAAFPHLKEVKPFAAGMSPTAYNVGKTNDPALREASFTFANWLCSDDSNQAGYLVESAFPACKSGLKAVANHPRMSDPNIKWLLTNALAFDPEITGGNWQPVFNAHSNKIFFTLQPDPFTYFSQQLQSVMLGQKTVEGMLKEIATKINTALGVKI